MDFRSPTSRINGYLTHLAFDKTSCEPQTDMDALCFQRLGLAFGSHGAVDGVAGALEAEGHLPAHSCEPPHSSNETDGGLEGRTAFRRSSYDGYTISHCCRCWLVGNRTFERARADGTRRAHASANLASLFAIPQLLAQISHVSQISSTPRVGKSKSACKI
jgi:hypothetical protein